MEGAKADQIGKYIDKYFDESVVPSLMDFIRIDNLSRSYDPEWNTNGKLEKAAAHVQQWVQSLNIKGLACDVIKDQGFAPLVFTEIKGDLPQTLFFYGHYDKQPPFVGWMEGLGPTDPKIIDGKLYGRGGADDGYATYCTMLALKALQQQKIPLPRCVMITEGDEESGSGHMSHYLQKLKPRIGDPEVFFCLDSGCLDYQRLWLTTSLRGNMVATLKVKTNEVGLHSGSFSGVVPSCFRITRMMLNKLENYSTGQIDKRFFVDVPPNRYAEMEATAQLFGETIYTNFPFFQGTTPITKDTLNCLLQRNWQPTVTVIGQSGFPEAESAGNVLHSELEVRVTVRLAPTFSAEDAEKTLREVLLKDVPYGATAELSNVRAASGWNASEYEPYFEAALKQSSQMFFGKSMCSFGMGGAIPLMGMLQKLWPGRPYLITGVLGPLSNAHGPNEFLHLPYAKKLTGCLAYVVAKSGEHLSKKI